MSKVKVSDLTNEQLDEWAARAQKLDFIMKNGRPCFVEDFAPETPAWIHDVEAWKCFILYSPTSNPAQWAELIIEFRIWLGEDIGANSSIHGWWAETSKGAKSHCYGPTPAIAICRAVVASVYGEYVEVSDV